jgi:hypothetical protein
MAPAVAAMTQEALMRRALLALATAGLVTGFAMPTFAQSTPTCSPDGLPCPIIISPPVHVWFLADGGMCVQVEDQDPVCTHPQPM